MNPISPERLRHAYLGWLEPDLPERAVNGTITFKRSTNGGPISDAAVDSAVGTFSRMLSYKAYGNDMKRKNKMLKFVAIKEGGQAVGLKHPHVHFLCEVPDGWSIDAWIEAVRLMMCKIKCFGSEHCLVEPGADAGWLNYMFKLRDKTSFADAVHVMSLRMTSRSA